jgi:peroxiredoxin
MFVKNIFVTVIFMLSLSLASCQAADLQNIADFTLLDYNGKSHTLSHIKDARAIVILFISTRCPVSNNYNESMIKLYDDYVPQKVRFLAVNSNKKEDAEEVKKHAQENKFEFPVLKDPQNKIKPFLKAQNAVFPHYVQNFKRAEDLIHLFSHKWRGAVPATFIFDKQGRQQTFLRGKHTFDEFKAKIEAIRRSG